MLTVSINGQVMGVDLLMKEVRKVVGTEGGEMKKKLEKFVVVGNEAVVVDGEGNVRYLEKR